LYDLSLGLAFFARISVMGATYIGMGAYAHIIFGSQLANFAALGKKNPKRLIS